MIRLMTGMMAALAMAGSASAQDDPRTYQPDHVISVKADPGQTSIAHSDPLSFVHEVALHLQFTCAQATCDKAQAQVGVDGAADQAITLTLVPQGGRLQASLVKSDGTVMATPVSFKVAPSQTEAFDVRIHWDAGHRVTFDLYRTDAATGASSMESRDIKLNDTVHQLNFRVSGGELKVLDQAYIFR